MAKNFSKSGITTGNTVKAGHVTQSIDAFTGVEAYDLTLSGSLFLTGSFIISGSGTLLTSGDTGSFITNSQTGSFIINSQTGSFITNSQTSSMTVLSSSFATTSSFISSTYISSSAAASGFGSGGGGSTIDTGSLGSTTITGSLTVSGSNTFTNIGPFSQTGTSTFSGSIQTLDQAFHLSASNLLIANGFISQSGTNTFAGIGKNIFGANIDLDVVRAYQIGGQSIAQWAGSGAIKIAETHAYPIQIGRSSLSQIELKGAVTASSTFSSSAGFIASTFTGDGAALTNLQRPISNSVSTNFTASNLNSGFYFRAGGNVTCSIQSGSLITCTPGNEYEIFQTSSAGYVLFLTGSGVTLNSKSNKIKLAGQFSAATLKKISSDPDIWDLIGDLG